MNIDHYDAQLARDIARRALEHDVHQRERDARRANYDDAYADMPVRRALDAMRVSVASTTPNAFAPRPPKPHKNTRMVVGPNAWESKADHARTHLRPDASCHHPLVNCVHKW